MPASAGFRASPVDRSNPTASPRVVPSSNNLTIVSCGSNPLLTAGKKKKTELIMTILIVLIKLDINGYYGLPRIFGMISKASA